MLDQVAMDLATLNLTLLTARRAEDVGAYSVARKALQEALGVLRGDGLIRVSLETRLARLPDRDTYHPSNLPGLFKSIKREHDIAS